MTAVEPARRPAPRSRGGDPAPGLDLEPGRAGAPHPLAALQETFGNLGVVRRLADPAVQARLEIGAPDDDYEREADRVAASIMRRPEPPAASADPQVQRRAEDDDKKKATPPPQRAPGAAQKAAPAPAPKPPPTPEAKKPAEAQAPKKPEPPKKAETPTTVPPPQTRKPEPKKPEAKKPDEKKKEPPKQPPGGAGKKREDETVARKPAGGKAPSLTPAASRTIQSQQGAGQPLSAAERSFFEPRLGHDLGAVRVHDDSAARSAARDISAQAFTYGQDVYFGAGRYRPGTESGRELLAHELAHTVQHGDVKRAGGPLPVSRALADLPEEDRKRIQVVTASVVVPGIAEKFATTGTTVTLPVPAGVTFETGVDKALEHGLSNVAASLSNGQELTPAPLVENSTITLELDVPSKGKGLYRFTYDVPPAPPGGKAPPPKILVEALGTATAPAGTKAPVAQPGQAPPVDPVADKIKKYSLSHSYSGTELDALRAAIAQIPDAQLAVVSGLKFARDTAKQSDPTAAGDYDPKTHTVTMYDKAFAASEARSKGAGTTASEPATRAIVHEIGHAIDLTSLRKAGAEKDKADAAIEALVKKYPDKTDPTKYSYPLGGPEEKEVKAAEKAQTDAEAALTKAQSISGTKSVKQPAGDFKDVVGTNVQGIKFREAMKKDGGKAATAYGDTDFQEAFAEAYSLYITSPDTLKTLRPNVYDFLDKNLPK